MRRLIAVALLLAQWLMILAPVEAGQTWYVKVAGPSTTPPADTCNNTLGAPYVKDAVDAAADGDIVQCAAGGPYSWTLPDWGIATSKGVTLQGAGDLSTGVPCGTTPIGTCGAATVGGTTIKVDRDQTSIYVTESPTSHPNILANFTFEHKTTDGHPTALAPIWMAPGGGPLPTITDAIPVLHHLTLRELGNTGSAHWIRVDTRKYSRALIYRLNVVTVQNWSDPSGAPLQSPIIRCQGGADPDVAMTTEPVIGSADTSQNHRMYVETSNFTNNAVVVDLATGCNSTFRYNWLSNAALSDHGHDSETYTNISFEVYNNTFVCAGPEYTHNGWYNSRSGYGIIADNIAPTAGHAGCWTGVYNFASKLYSLGVREPFGDCYPGPGNIYSTNPGGAPYPFPGQQGWGWAGSGGPYNQQLKGIRVYGNKHTAGGTVGEADTYSPINWADYSACGFDNSANNTADFIQSNREFYISTDTNCPANPAGNCAKGIGNVTRAQPRSQRPASCFVPAGPAGQGAAPAAGVVWLPSENSDAIDVCTATNTWTNNWYVKAPYPHPLAIVTGAAVNVPGGLGLPFRR